MNRRAIGPRCQILLGDQSQPLNKFYNAQTGTPLVPTPESVISESATSRMRLVCSESLLDQNPASLQCVHAPSRFVSNKSRASESRDEVTRMELHMNLPTRKAATPPDPLKHFANEAADVKLEAMRIDRRYSLLTRAVTVLGGGGGIGSAVVLAMHHWWG